MDGNGDTCLDVSSAVEFVQLVHDLKHRPLNFVVAASTVVKSSASNHIDLVEEHNARLLRSGHLEELPDHSGPFSDVFLDKLGADDADKAGVSPIGDCSG